MTAIRKSTALAVASRALGYPPMHTIAGEPAPLAKSVAEATRKEAGIEV